MADYSSSIAPVSSKCYRRAPAKVFQCRGYGDCRMVFSRSEHLARHIRSHTGHFACHCKKKFSRLEDLRQHTQSIHADKQEQNERMIWELLSTDTTEITLNVPRKSFSEKGSRHVGIVDNGAIFHSDGPFDPYLPSRKRFRNKAPMLAWADDHDGSESSSEQTIVVGSGYDDQTVFEQCDGPFDVFIGKESTSRFDECRPHAPHSDTLPPHDSSPTSNGTKRSKALMQRIREMCDHPQAFHVGLDYDDSTTKITAPPLPDHKKYVHTKSNDVDTSLSINPQPVQSKPSKLGPRVYVSCLQCRTQKIRCDGAKSVCHNCGIRNTECLYKPLEVRQQSGGGIANKSLPVPPINNTTPKEKYHLDGNSGTLSDISHLCHSRVSQSTSSVHQIHPYSFPQPIVSISIENTMETQQDTHHHSDSSGNKTQPRITCRNCQKRRIRCRTNEECGPCEQCQRMSLVYDHVAAGDPSPLSTPTQGTGLSNPIFEPTVVFDKGGNIDNSITLSTSPLAGTNLVLEDNVHVHLDLEIESRVSDDTNESKLPWPIENVFEPPWSDVSTIVPHVGFPGNKQPRRLRKDRSNPSSRSRSRGCMERKRLIPYPPKRPKVIDKSKYPLPDWPSSSNKDIVINVPDPPVHFVQFPGVVVPRKPILPLHPNWLLSLHHDWGSCGPCSRRDTGDHDNRRYDVVEFIRRFLVSWSWSTQETFNNASGFGIHGSSIVSGQNIYYINNYYPLPVQNGNSGPSQDELLRKIENLEKRNEELEAQVKELTKKQNESTSENVLSGISHLETSLPPGPEPPPDRRGQTNNEHQNSSRKNNILSSIRHSLQQIEAFPEPIVPSNKEVLSDICEILDKIQRRLPSKYEPELREQQILGKPSDSRRREYHPYRRPSPHRSRFHSHRSSIPTPSPSSNHSLYDRSSRRGSPPRTNSRHRSHSSIYRNSRSDSPSPGASELRLPYSSSDIRRDHSSNSDIRRSHHSSFRHFPRTPSRHQYHPLYPNSSRNQLPYQ